MRYLYSLKEISTNLLENQNFIELARKISILKLYPLMILNQSFFISKCYNSIIKLKETTMIEDNIKFLRKIHGLTQSEFARIA